MELSIVTFDGTAGCNCCKNKEPVPLESRLFKKDEPEMLMFDTFKVPNAPPPLGINLENASRMLQ